MSLRRLDFRFCLQSAAANSCVTATDEYIYQINKHLQDITSDQILRVIQKNVPIIGFQGQAARYGYIRTQKTPFSILECVIA